MSESLEIKRVLDYLPGDLVQVVSGEHQGRLGKIVDSKLSRSRTFLLYYVMFDFKDEKPVIQLAKAEEIRFLSHAEE